MHGSRSKKGQCNTFFTLARSNNVTINGLPVEYCSLFYFAETGDDFSFQLQLSAPRTQDDSEVLSNQTTEYIQNDVVIADTDKYKLTVTGYDPDYSQDNSEGFLIKMVIENKAEKELMEQK